MTLAVCMFCGDQKIGAFSPCPACQRTPRLEDDLVQSLAMTDHYFSKDTLDFMSEAMKNGCSAPMFDPDFCEKIREAIKPWVADLFAMANDTPDPARN